MLTALSLAGAGCATKRLAPVSAPLAVFHEQEHAVASARHSTLFQDRDYPVLNDYRALLGGPYRSLWGLSTDRCTRVFPQLAPLDLRLI